MRKKDPLTSTLWTLLFQRHAESRDIFLQIRQVQMFFDKLLGLGLDGAIDLSSLQAKFQTNLLSSRLSVTAALPGWLQLQFLPNTLLFANA